MPFTNRGLHTIATGYLWASDAVGVALATSTFVPTVDLNTMSQVTNELSGGNYARVTSIANRYVTENDTDDRIELGGDNVEFPGLLAAAGTPAWAIIYDNRTGSDATRPILGYVALTTPATPNGNNYTIDWDGAGGSSGDIFRIGHAP